MSLACQTNCESEATGIVVLDNLNQLRNQRVGSCSVVAKLLGRSYAGDGLGGTFRYDSSSNLGDDGVSVVSSRFGGEWLKIF